ncbi:Inositol 2-dehydrogenase/D-chiro-inositol 3-dehydrogenase [Dyadobacter sp. CECT 9275]|uniref:Inositol 2-dehydrogenase/D-chiro-inositol 3-dehydrogenase n=1 Tax=Dyadobacter helix TaxID=2822344 RepID=A0A916JFW1_9BACT|nr:Gfo/Idh/MocA family oxidoreductase [Dyadobacter sp. CECT 9275]CAG5000872.1 Inositol 2-dehydrogenase/D-chiro-inositol 3-dehydrogenase [Dyadobacter sp. CECT 9275]
MNEDSKPALFPSRRTFVKESAAIVGGILTASGFAGKAHGWSLNNDPIKVALIGCGSRGAGAALNALSANANAVLVAMADVFQDKLDETYATLMKVGRIKDFVKVPQNQKFVGFDAYEKAIACADVVLLVTPPAFRPSHFAAAVKAGKHVFMEKPLASDAPGIRQVLETGKEATRKNLKVLVGLQNRYDPGYQEMVKKIQQGAIGRIISATDYYLIGPVTNVPRVTGQTEMEFQMRNWRYFNWLWAGSPAGLQIHNTDIVNWVKGGYPIRAQGMGGRSSLKGPDHGDIFDHFYIEYEYADGTKLNSQIRHISGTWNKGGATFQGATGSASLQAGIKNSKGEQIWRNPNKDSENAYQIEHNVLFAAIRNNTPLNDTEWGAKSTMTTILGRMAVHSGKLVEWDEAFHSDLTLMPDRFAWDAEPPVKPDKDGNYPVPIPGLSKVL